jgi:predicted MFS family arabinose efflux permease
MTGTTPYRKMPYSDNPAYRWYVLALLTTTGTLVAAISNSCMPVLFPEMSEDLGLDLVQIGTVWGIPSLAGIFVSILGGVLSDKFNLRAILIIFSILTGVTGALRGLANDFFSLTATVLLNGMVRMVVPVAITKMVGTWFTGPKHGLAQGISAVGMGLGLMLGPLISATLLSPALGGWQHVMYFYGAISALVGILWLFMSKQPPQAQTASETTPRLPLRQALGKLLRLKVLWLLGFTLMFRVGGLMGMTGYLSLYLQGKGWSGVAADGALSLFYAMSTICVIPLSFLSYRLGSKKAIMLPALLAAIVSLGLLPVVPASLTWILIALSGMFMDGFMALIITMLIETKGVGVEYAGMAVGITFSIAQVGNLVGPPLGNAFADINTGLPFTFWAILSAVALISFVFVKEPSRQESK